MGNHCEKRDVDNAPGFLQNAYGTGRDAPGILEAARSGDGIGWHAHNSDVHLGCERFFRPGYHAHLMDEWLPALDGVVAKLEGGGAIADIGCGHGTSTILMAEALPTARVTGSDHHAGSVETARQRAAAAGVAERARFEVAHATAFSGGGTTS